MNQIKKESDKSLVILGIPVLALVACCGLPLLLSAIGLTAFGAYLAGKTYWILGGIVLLVGLIILFSYVRKRKKAGCCKPSTKKGE